MNKQLKQLEIALKELAQSGDVSKAAFSTLLFALKQLKEPNFDIVNSSVLDKAEMINALTNTLKVNKESLGNYYELRDDALLKLMIIIKSI